MKSRLIFIPLLTFLSSAFVVAQQAPENGGQNVAIEELVVSGSRITNDTGFVAPTPVTTQTAADFLARGATNVQEILYDLPQVSRENPGGTGSGNPGGDYVNLRNLGSERSLVLLNGRRHVATSIQGNVDMSMIPSSLIERLEVVTGGASAAWGSDAVSGVMNVILKDKWEGFSVSGQFNTTQLGDGEKTTLQIGGGRLFMDDRLSLMFGAETSNQTPLTTIEDRDWGEAAWAQIRPTGGTTDDNGNYTGLAYKEVNNATFSRITAGGVINTQSVAGYDCLGTTGSSSTRCAYGRTPGLQFGTNGELLPFNYGTNISGVYMEGGDGAYYGRDYNILNDDRRNNTLFRASFDINEDTMIWAESSYAQSATEYDIIVPYDYQFDISRDNAYLPDDLAARMDNLGATEFEMGRAQYEWGPDIVGGKNMTHRFAFGAEGVMFDDWNWSAYYQTGTNRYEYDLWARVQDRFWEQINSVRATEQLDGSYALDPTAGLPMCRSTFEYLNEIAAGGTPTLDTKPTAVITNGGVMDAYGENPMNCVPANVFGAGNVSDAAVAYSQRHGWLHSEFEQNVFAFDIQGQLGSTLAGDISIAAGYERREETLIGTVDDFSADRRLRLGNPQPISGSLEVQDVYAEVVIPMFADMPLSQQSDLNLAVRWSDYDSIGSTTTWKAGLSHQFNDQVRIRATRSYDFRAPTLYELFYRSQGSGTAVDPFRNDESKRVVNATGGNALLGPETSETFTAGIVYRPSFVEGLQMSVDYYEVEIDGAVGTLGSAGTLERCFDSQGASPLCAGIERGAPDPADPFLFGQQWGPMEVITSYRLNLDTLKASGVDLEALYSFGLGDGVVRLRAIASQFLEDSSAVGGTFLDEEGEIGATNRVNLSATYTQGPAVWSLYGRRMGAGVVDIRREGVVDGRTNDIDAFTYWGASVRYDLVDNSDGMKAQVFFKVDNLLDTDPPFIHSTSQQPTRTNSALYDTLGRRFALGFSVEF